MSRKLSWHRWRQQMRRFWGHARQRGNVPLLFAGCLCLLTFTYPTVQQPSLVRDVMFVIDISESMNVPDADYPRQGSRRLQHAQALVGDMMAALPCGSRTTLGLFAGDEVVVLFEPLEVCAHYPAIEKIVSQLQTRMRWIGDSWVVRGVKAGLDAAKQRNMQLVFVTDADEMPHHEHPRVAELLPYKRQVQGLLIGVGRPSPQPVPHLNALGEVARYWTPEEAVIQGNYPNLLAEVKALPPGQAMSADMAAEVREHQSQFNESLMQQMASALDFSYIRAASAPAAMAALRQLDSGSEAETAQDARWMLGGVALVLILISWFWPVWMPARPQASMRHF